MAITKSECITDPVGSDIESRFSPSKNEKNL